MKVSGITLCIYFEIGKIRIIVSLTTFQPAVDVFVSNNRYWKESIVRD